MKSRPLKGYPLRVFAAPVAIAHCFVAPVWAMPPDDQAAYSTTFYAFLENEYEIEILRSPMTLTLQGCRERYNEWDDLSDNAILEQRAAKPRRHSSSTSTASTIHADGTQPSDGKAP